ncbi:MAG: hypothetical protein E7645_06800 [Ruminococcaceae bacterium]|nr:hypothetical protein [Oscillospiraceae bacterium]
MDNNNQEKSGFTYTYSAQDQTELKRIRNKYTAPTETEDKMTRLRRLDASVTQTAQITALVCGIIGALILGFGMSLIMTELAEILGLNGDMATITGIITGVFGGVLASLAYPIYNVIVRAKRKKLAPEILRLTDELMK